MKEDNNVYNILGTIPDTCSILKSVISSLSFIFVTELREVGERSTQLTPWKWMECVSLLENVGFSFGKEAPGWMSRVAIKNRHWAPKPENKEHNQSPNATSSVRVEALAKRKLEKGENKWLSSQLKIGIICAGVWIKPGAGWSAGRLEPCNTTELQASPPLT